MSCGGKINDADAKHKRYWNEVFSIFASQIFHVTQQKSWERYSQCNPLQISDCLLKMVISHRIQRKTLNLPSTTLTPQPIQCPSETISPIYTFQFWQHHNIVQPKCICSLSFVCVAPALFLILLDAKLNAACLVGCLVHKCHYVGSCSGWK